MHWHFKHRHQGLYSSTVQMWKQGSNSVCLVSLVQTACHPRDSASTIRVSETTVCLSMLCPSLDSSGVHIFAYRQQLLGLYYLSPTASRAPNTPQPPKVRPHEKASWPRLILVTADSEVIASFGSYWSSLLSVYTMQVCSIVCLLWPFICIFTKRFFKETQYQHLLQPLTLLTSEQNHRMKQAGKDLWDPQVQPMT